MESCVHSIITITSPTGGEVTVLQGQTSYSLHYGHLFGTEQGCRCDLTSEVTVNRGSLYCILF